MPEALHVLGRTVDGRLWWTVRHDTFWDRFLNLSEHLGLSGPDQRVVDVACGRNAGLGSPTGMWLVVALLQAPPRLFYWEASLPGTGWRPVNPSLSSFPVAQRVALTATQGQNSGV